MAEEKKSAKKASEPDQSKVFDVEHPSKLSPSPTSKPAIVGHTNTIKKDPVLAPNDEEKPKEADGKITYLNNPEEEDKKEANAVSQDLKNTENHDPADEHNHVGKKLEASEEVQQEATTNESDENSKEEENPNNDEKSAAVDELIKGVNTKKDRIEQQDKERQKDVEIESLVSSKKFFVKTSLPSNKRNLRWLVVLLLLAVIGGGAWYYMYGPGQDIWDIDTSPVAEQVQPNNQKENQPQTVQETVQIESEEHGIKYVIPKEWNNKIIQNDLSVVTQIDSDVEEIYVASLGNDKNKKTPVYMRTSIISGPTFELTAIFEDASSSFKNCISEDVIFNNGNSHLIYFSQLKEPPMVEAVLISNDRCLPGETEGSFDFREVVSIGDEKKTYVIFSFYVLADEYFAQAGISDEQEIRTIRSNSLGFSKDDFKSSKTYEKLQRFFTSIEELKKDPAS